MRGPRWIASMRGTAFGVAPPLVGSAIDPTIFWSGWLWEVLYTNGW